MPSKPGAPAGDRPVEHRAASIDDDRSCASAGNDTLSGGGSDALYSGTGKGTITGGAGYVGDRRWPGSALKAGCARMGSSALSQASPARG
jgi:hypothetical protein